MAKISKIGLVILAILILLAIQFRLFFAFQTPHYSSDTAYDIVRQVGHIVETGRPLIEDSLVERSAYMLAPPLFSYILAMISSILPMHLVLKVVPVLFIATLIPIVFLITRRITNNESAALFSSFIMLFTPILYKTVGSNSVSVYSLAVPLLFFLLYSFMRLHEEKYLHAYVVCMVLLPLVHPIAAIVLPIFLIYLLLTKMERIKSNVAEKEIILFTFLYVLWATFILYKKALLEYGSLVLWQNIPQSVLNEYFTTTTILDAIIPIGLLPFILGLVVMYKTLLVEKDANLYLMFSAGLSFGLLVWFRLIELEVGLLMIAVVLCILFGRAYSMFLYYLERTHFARLYYVVVGGLFAIVVLTSIIPTAGFAKENIDNALDPGEYLALEWIKEYTEEGSTVLAPLEEGHYVTAIANRKVIGTANYLFLDDINQRTEDIERMYATQYQTEALNLLSKYSVDYIFFSKELQEEIGFTELRYANNDCFELVLDFEYKVYKVKCVLGGSP